MTDSKENMGFFGSMSEVKLNELRRMIIGLDTEDLRRLAYLVNDPDKFSEEISELLPNSIRILLDKGKINHTDIIPIVEEALRDSVQRNPKALSDILFPVMLPAIRKAVAEDIRTMIDSLNRTLEHGFSPRRIGWRFKALFSGMSYAEIVLSHAYIFRVKQVFLIHKKTGILLNSVSENDEKVTTDDDMVSSMLSAIKDFVQDSFSVDDDKELNEIKVGNFNIWIEQGPGAIIAAVIDGDAPSSLRKTLKETVEQVHIKHSYYLENFDGDTSIFQKVKPILSESIVSEQKEEKKRKPIILIILLIIILGLIGYWGYTAIEKSIRLNKLEESLSNTPGIVLTDDYNKDGKKIFVGIRDPFAMDPYQLSAISEVDSSEVGFDLSPYISLEPGFILKRAYLVLAPPPSISLRYSDGTIYATGTSESDWVDYANNNYMLVNGVNSFNFASVEIQTSRKKIKQTFESIERYSFCFDYEIVKLSEKQKVKFDSLIADINKALDFDFNQDSVPVIIVEVLTSYKGNPEANERYAYERAQEFINLMINGGIPMEVLVPRTKFVEDLKEEYPARCVYFRVTFSKPEDL